jgi:hypothetical protein
MTISLAFTCKGFAGKILRGNDISYVYHMPVINIFVQLTKNKSIAPYSDIVFDIYYRDLSGVYFMDNTSRKKYWHLKQGKLSCVK